MTKKSILLLILSIFITSAIFIYCNLEFAHCPIEFSHPIECGGISTLSSISDHISSMIQATIGIIPLLLIIFVALLIDLYKQNLLQTKFEFSYLKLVKPLSHRQNLLSWLDIVNNNDPNAISGA